MKLDEKIPQEGSNHNADNRVPHTKHSHRHDHHHRHHHRGQSYHHRNQSNHHNNHRKHVSKHNRLKTVDVDDFFEHPLPNNFSLKKKTQHHHEDGTVSPIRSTESSDNGSSSGLSESFYSPILSFNGSALIKSNENKTCISRSSKDGCKCKEEEAPNTWIQSTLEHANASQEVSSMQKKASRFVEIDGNDSEKQHCMKASTYENMIRPNVSPKVVIPTAPSQPTQRLYKMKCPESLHPPREEDMIKIIRKCINSCNQNYEEVEKQINNTFATFSFALNHRRKTLTEGAKQIRDRKLTSLNKIMENLGLSDKSRSGTVTEISTIDINCETHEIKNSLEKLEEYNGIHEPWKSCSILCAPQEDKSSPQDEESSNYQTCSRSPRFDISSSSSGYNTSSSPEHSIYDDIARSHMFSAGEIEEGNMTFSYDYDADLDFIINIGKLKEDLSSPQFTITKGLSDSGAIIGDRARLEVHTMDKYRNPNSNNADKIVIRVYDCNRNKVQVDEDFASSNSQKFVSHNKSRKNEIPTSIYCYSFVPLKPGKYEVVVKLNGIHISTSPFNFVAYPRLNLTFTSPHQMVENTKISSRSTSRCPRGSSSDTEEVDNDDKEGDCQAHSNNLSENWVIHKNRKSSLLQSLCSHPSNIYAYEPVLDTCAWQVRITTACMNIKLSIGLKTRSSIPDIDEQFTCDFNLETFAYTYSSLDRANNVPQYTNNRGARRKSSIFNRLLWTFTLLLNDGVLRVTCHELEQDRRVDINLRGAFPLHPYCSMIHHHSDDITPQLCPRPQLTFL